MEALAMIRQVFGEESMSRTQEDHTHQHRRKAREVMIKVKSMLNIFFHPPAYAIMAECLIS
jgi:hypothetical protein